MHRGTSDTAMELRTSPGAYGENAFARREYGNLMAIEAVEWLIEETRLRWERRHAMEGDGADTAPEALDENTCESLDAARELCDLLGGASEGSGGKDEGYLRGRHPNPRRQGGPARGQCARDLPGGGSGSSPGRTNRGSHEHPADRPPHDVADRAAGRAPVAGEGTGRRRGGAPDAGTGLRGVRERGAAVHRAWGAGDVSGDGRTRSVSRARQRGRMPGFLCRRGAIRGP